MQSQFRMTEERPELTRTDIAELIKKAPKGYRNTFVKRELEKLGTPPADVDKILSDLDNY